MNECYMVGIDNSECSSRALGFAAERAKSASAKLVVVYVIEWSPYSFNTPEENAMRHKRREEEIEAATKSVLTPALKKLKASGLTVEGIVRHGNVAGVLSGLAGECGANQMFVGRIGGSGLTTMLFGSVTSKLVQMSTVPVTIVP